MGTAGLSGDLRFYYFCGDIWSSQCKLNKYTQTPASHVTVLTDLHTDIHTLCVGLHRLKLFDHYQMLFDV